MDKFSDESTCRICFKKQDTVFSLFRKRKGISPCEKLNRIGLKADVDDAGPTCICCDCLSELDTTVNFLEKCEKSNRMLAEHLSRGLEFTEEIAIFKDNLNVEVENNSLYSENRVVGAIQDVRRDSTSEDLKSSEVLGLEDPCCEECGSRRRCRHWAPPATHTCPYCQKVFNRKFNFKLHLKRHSRDRDWSCARCGARAVSRWLAARHCAPRVRRACPVPGCGKTYTTNTNLNTHLRAHNGEKPFDCTDCGKNFSSKNTLENHKRIHTGALPYICPICGKRFRTNKLSGHMSTHSGARHACARAGCAKRFTSRAALARHVRAHAPAAAGARAHAPAAAGARAHAPAAAGARAHAPAAAGARAHAPAAAGARAHAPAAAGARAHAPAAAGARAHAPAAAGARAPSPQHACALCPARYHHKQSLNKHVRKQHAQNHTPVEVDAVQITKEIQCDL